jgi:hypothetical protein
LHQVLLQVADPPRLPKPAATTHDQPAAAAAAADVAALANLAAAASRLSDIDLLTGPADMSMPMSGPCPRLYKTTTLPHKQPHPACNAFLLAASVDWQLQQEQQCEAYGVSSSSSSVSRCIGRLSRAEWAAGLAVRGGNGAELASVLAEVDEQLSVGQYGAEPSSSSYTAELSVAQAAGEALLQAQLLQIQQQQRGSSSCNPGQFDQQLGLATTAAAGTQSGIQLPLSRLSWLANVLLLAGPASYCLSGGGAAAADRLSALAAVCRSEAVRQVQLQNMPSRAARRAPVFEHYLCRKVPGLGAQGGLLEVLKGMYGTA